MEKINKNQLLREVTVHLDVTAIANGSELSNSSQLPHHLIADQHRPVDHARVAGNAGWERIHNMKNR